MRLRRALAALAAWRRPVPSAKLPRFAAVPDPAAPARFDAAAYDFAAAHALGEALGISHVLAQVLVRRGLAEPAAARAFLTAEARHPLDAFGGLREGAQLILDAVRGGAHVTVHGDYDADGVCSTAILLRALASVGAQADWYLPSRSEDGYGLALPTVEKLAARGTTLLIATDCAITAVEPVARAKELGMEVVVCDHHTPRADGQLPDAAIVHPRLGGYPCPELCAGGVAHLMARALLEADGQDPELADEDLDLVAIATVADVVPLIDENRRLVRDGLRALAVTRKPGLQALMEVAKVDPAAVDATAIGFRLAPRINAAGRLYRADAGLELALTPDAERATAIASELHAINAERRDVETRIRFEAEAQVSEQGEQAAYVLAGEGWHAGVVGIVAARIAERHHRPAVLIALDPETGEGTGSGRSIAGFDLLGGLDASAEHLLGHGGHRAAAGLTIKADQVEAFRAAFAAHAQASLKPEDLVPSERVDAVVAGGALDLELAEELALLEPFGQANPAVSLQICGATLSEPRQLGEGRHVSCTLTAGGARSRLMCFGSSSLPVPEDTPVDCVVKLEINRFRGAVEPRLTLRRVRLVESRPVPVLGEPEAADEWLRAALAELDAPLAVPERAPTRREHDQRGAGIAGVVGDLVASGAQVLVVAAHAGRRGQALARSVGGSGISVVDWSALERAPELAEPFEHVVALDPPARAGAHAHVAGRGWLHAAWGEPERELALAVHRWEYDLEAPARELYRELRAAETASGETLRALLAGTADPPRTAALAGRLVRVLVELRLVELVEGPILRVTDPPQRTELERSEAFRAYRDRLEDGTRFLTQITLPTAA